MYERFELLLSEHNMKAVEFCRESGIPQSTISTWKSGKHEVKQSTMKKIADFFEVPLAWLLGESDSREEEPQIVKIPVFSSVSAGSAQLNAQELIIGYEDIPSSATKTGEYFGLKIKGDSMTPTILDGDVVIVKKQNTADSGRIVIALINGEDGVCKKLIKRQDGILLKSINEEYGNFEYTNEQIQKLPVVIIGVVEQLRRNF